MRHAGWFGLGAALGAGAAALAVREARERARREAARIEAVAASPGARGRNIVILGAGFAGMLAADGLLRRLPPETGWTVTLVDRHNYFLFTPLLYHAATGLVDPTSILYPVRSLSRKSNFVFREAEVLGVDPHRRTVFLDDGVLAFDYLVLALGSVPNFYGLESRIPAALTLKSVGDAVLLRNRVIDAFEAADICDDPVQRRRLLTFAVVGAGATGVELAGALRGLVRGTLARQYPRVHPDETRIHVYQAGDDILPNMPRSLARFARARLAELGVTVHTGSPVRGVTWEGLQTGSGDTLPAATVVWTAGVRPSPLAAGIPVPRAADGRLEVDPYFEMPGLPGCYAVGDVAAVPGEADLLPPSAAVACQEGRAVARILLARLEGRQPEPFAYRYRGELVSLGRHEAVAEVGGVQLRGFPAWLVWRAFYLSQLMGFKNRVAVALDWSFAYAYQRETVRLELPSRGWAPVGPLETGRTPAR